MGGTVLCVDNDRNLCEILAKALRSEGYRVATAHDGDAALEAVERVKPDLVLLDLMLPKRDGFAVLEAVRRLPPPRADLPVVLISGCSPTPEYTRRAETLRAAALLRKPVSLENLLAAVARELGQSPGRAPARAAAAGADAGLAGSFDQLSFAALLHHLHGLRATGVLHLSSERKRKWLRLRDGYPIAVRSNLVNECLGNHLVRAGRITASVLAESRRRMKGGQLQGEILVAMDLLSEDEIATALRAQAEEKLFEIFGWPSGSFRFEVGGHLQRANDLSLERSPANLILEGVRSRLPIERIDAHLAAHSHYMLGLAESPFYRFQDVDLDPAELKLVKKLDRPRRLAEFIGADESLRRTMYALIAAGTLELRGEGAAIPKAEKILAPRSAVAARAAKRAEPSAKVAPLREVVRPAPTDATSADLAALAQRFRGQTPFQILDITETADEQQIQDAYGKLCERTHPDRVSHANAAVKVLAAEVFATVANAYETLVDPRRRQSYLLDARKADRDAAEREVGRRALDAQMQFQQGDAALRARDYSAALRCFGRALELYPEEGEYHAHYGWTLHLAHPSDLAMASEAIEHVQRAIKLAPDQEKPYLFMGRLCKAIGRPGAAEKMFARALKIQPECLDALRELRLINMRREKGKGLIGRLLRR